MKMFLRRISAAVIACAMIMLVGCDDSGKSYMEMDITQYLTLGEYKGLTVELTDYNTTDTEIQAVIESDFAGYTKQTEILKRKIKKDDNVVVSWTATIDGEAFEGNTATEYLLRVGITPYEAVRNEMNSFPQLEEALIGHVSGDTFELEVTYPENYSDSPTLAGKKALYSVTIKKVYVVQMPELTEDLLYEVTGYKSYDEYRANTVEKINQYYKDKATADAKTKLWVKVCENSELIKNPKDKFEEEYDKARQHYIDLADQYSMKLEDMLDQLGLSESELSTNCNEQAADIVFEDMIFYSIVKAENIALDDKEYKERATKYAKDMNIEFYQLEAQYGYDGVYEVVLYDKMLDFLYENNTVKVNSSNTAE